MDHPETSRPLDRAMPRGRIVVAMSGGVDSSLAAALMLQEGWEAVGVTLDFRMSGSQALPTCGAEEAIHQARAVADHLGIPHEVLPAGEAFEAAVLRPAWEEYARGRTPSPCLRCNRWIKFGLLLEYAQRIGAEAVATGHYARLHHDGPIPRLRRGRDETKDQSYFLAELTLDQLRRIRLPLGDFSKPDVRERARLLGLPTASRPDSQDACFSIQALGFPETLRQLVGAPARIGPLVDTMGKVLGEHAGFHRYTIGQRRGLGIALGARAHVVGLREADAAVILSLDARDVQAKGLAATGVHWLDEIPARALLQIRSRHRAAEARIVPTGGDSLEAWFETPQTAVTPGQAVGFYEGDRLIGGGWIERALAQS